VPAQAGPSLPTQDPSEEDRGHCKTTIAGRSHSGGMKQEIVAMGHCHAHKYVAYMEIS
jgi:hypothetical protein